MSVGGGRLLRNKIRLAVGKDVDTLRSPGAYGVDTPSNGPEDAGDLFVIFVVVGKDDDERRVHQTAHSLEGNGDHIRYYDGSVWSEWSELGSGGGGGGDGTDLSTLIDSDSVTVRSNTGDDAEIPSATTTDAGVLSAADKETIDNLGSMAFEAAEDFIRAVDIGVLVQAWDADLDAIAALTTTSYGRGFLDLADAAAGRTKLSLGTMATATESDYYTTSEVDTLLGDYLTETAAAAAYQPLDSDLTALAALTTTTYGRDFNQLADAAAGRTKLGLGTMAVATESDYYTTSEADALLASKQPLDSDLTSIAGLSTTAAGRSVLTVADPNADRVMAWDDSAGAIVPIALADIASEGSPAAGDFLLAYLADGTLAKIDWDDLPSGGSGIASLLEDTTPQLGGDLDLNEFDITGTGNVLITGNIEVTGFFSLATGDMTVTTVHANIVNVSDEAYDQSGWNADLSVPTKNAVRDELETNVIKTTGTRTLDDDLGLTATSKDDGTKSSGTFTLDFSANFRKCVNNGAFTLAPPSSGEGMVFLRIENDSSAGAITTSGFTKVVGDSFTTTNDHVFFCTIVRAAGSTMLSVVAMQ